MDRNNRWLVEHAPNKLGPLTSSDDNLLGETTFRKKKLISVILGM